MHGVLANLDAIRVSFDRRSAVASATDFPVLSRLERRTVYTGYGTSYRQNKRETGAQFVMHSRIDEQPEPEAAEHFCEEKARALLQNAHFKDSPLQNSEKVQGGSNTLAI